jgi:cbb3-type cytochrome oxidase cytochrome c subunit
MSTSVVVSVDHSWPYEHKYSVTIDDTRNDLNADEMHEMIYKALLALQYTPDTVKDLREEVNEEAKREERAKDFKERYKDQDEIQEEEEIARSTFGPM